MRNLLQSILILLFLISGSLVWAQSTAYTFQRVWKANTAFQCQDARETPDGGFILAGIGDTGNGDVPYLLKTDCLGRQEWMKTFEATASPNNQGTRVIVTRDSGYAFVSQIGSFGSYDILVVRLDSLGNIIWKRIMAGSRNDMADGIAQADDGGFVVSGMTNSFGTDAATNYEDAYLLKLDSLGNPEWGRTYGNFEAIDRARAVVATNDGGFAVTGSYIVGGTFYCWLMKTDGAGNPVWARAIGQPNHATHGYGLSTTSNGGFVLTGSTTVLKNNFQDWSDILVARFDAQGDSVWIKVFHGNNQDRFENGVGIAQGYNDEFAVGCATASYPSTGFVPNKHGILRLADNGMLIQALNFNRGGSHFPQLHRGWSSGYLITGYTNWTGYGLNGNTFSPVLIKMDDLFYNPCFSYDVTSITTDATPAFDWVDNVTMSLDSGLTILADTFWSPFSMVDTTLCVENAPTCGTITSAPAPSGTPELLNVWPNPAAGQVTLDWSGHAPAQFQIRDSRGVLLRKGVLEVGKTRIDLENFPAGLYFLRVHSDGEIFSRKVIIQ